MGLLRGIGRLSGRVGRRVAVRSRWLARRLWLVMVADIALAGRRHWKRLEPAERERLIALARKSRGRPGRYLSARERREASALLDKLGHVELAGSVAEIVLPFKPLSRLATRMIVGRRRRAEERAEAS
jgi:hypothetical protein